MKKMKVVFLHHKLVCGGAEQALYDLILLMDQSKFDISVFVLNCDGEWEQKFKNAGIHVLHLFERRERGTGLASFLHHQWKKIQKIWLLKRGSEKVLQRFFPDGVDLVVSYHIGEAFGLPFLSTAKSVKYIHGNVSTNESYCRDILKLNDILPKYDRIVCVSKAALQAFRQVTGITDNVEMHYNPMNSDIVRAMAEEPIDIPGDLPVICAVGRLSPEKGYDRLIRIHKRILDQGIHHRLVIVGDGPEKENLLNTVQQTNTKDTVHMVGYKSNPYPYMKASTFLVCASYTEGLPVTAMEALSLGIPIVSAVPSIEEAFGTETCGLITENTDWSLEQGIIKMLVDQVCYSRAKTGAIRQSKFFDGKKMVGEIEKLYLNLIG